MNVVVVAVAEQLEIVPGVVTVLFQFDKNQCKYTDPGSFRLSSIQEL